MLFKEVHTKCLRLRAFTQEDSAAITSVLQEKEVAPTTLRVPYPYKEEDAMA